MNRPTMTRGLDRSKAMLMPRASSEVRVVGEEHERRQAAEPIA